MSPLHDVNESRSGNGGGRLDGPSAAVQLRPSPPPPCDARVVDDRTDWCDEGHAGGWYCTLREGHAGAHWAHTGDDSPPVFVWSDDEDCCPALMHPEGFACVLPAEHGGQHGTANTPDEPIGEWWT